MKKYMILAVIAFCFTLVPVASAKEVNHFVSKVSDDVELASTYNGSVASAGQNIELNGNVKGLSALAGNNIKFNGTSDYIAIAGNNINITSTINNDAFVAGNIITLDNAIIKRDLIAAGSDVQISGTFERNVSIYAGKVTVPK